MQVNTKYNVGHNLYYIEDNKVCRNEVIKIIITMTKSNPLAEIGYLFKHSAVVRREHEISDSLQDLIHKLPVEYIS